MSRIVWDQEGQKKYENGVSNGVLYPMTAGKYGEGVAWNGLTAVSESPSGAEPTKLWADNINYLTLMSAEEYASTVEAYTYPDEFAECDGSAEISTGVFVGQQTRKKFGLVYKTKIGNDTEGESYGYKIHILYNAQAAPSEKAYATINDSPEAMTFSWEISSTPIGVANQKPSSTVVIDSTKVETGKLKLIEDKLFGGETAEDKPTLLSPDEIIELLK